MAKEEGQNSCGGENIEKPSDNIRGICKIAEALLVQLEDFPENVERHVD